ncbi:MAG: dimethyl sulfoxide reductase anchor subunit [Alphaproteobacteria bacterium]|nr:dimethyl sulfoxide reductase anchor subunit [Alphaproteobacteria bacterium]
MHPAYSVIVFTVASGAGYGLLFAIAAAALAGVAPAGSWFAIAASALALALAGIGGAASFFHLGHPERAWRALSQWRSSWLSREAVLALAAVPVALGFGVAWTLAGTGTAAAWLPAVAVGAAAVAVATVIATSKIYATLRAIPAWHNPWVTPGYLACAGLSGALLLQGMVAIAGQVAVALPATAAAAAVVAGAIKLAYWRSIDRAPPASTAESATGLGRFGAVTLLDPPHTSTNFLLTEMGYRVARRHARRLRAIAAIAAFLVPGLLSLALVWIEGVWAVVGASLAVAGATLGLVVERWLFFAEAKHTVTLYYGDARV